MYIMHRVLLIVYLGDMHLSRVSVLNVDEIAQIVSKYTFPNFRILYFNVADVLEMKSYE